MDDSEISVNYCIGVSDDHQGNDLEFSGVRCQKHIYNDGHYDQNVEKYIYKNVPGRALIHLGNHRHCALPLK